MLTYYDTAGKLKPAETSESWSREVSKSGSIPWRSTVDVCVESMKTITHCSGPAMRNTTGKMPRSMDDGPLDEPSLSSLIHLRMNTSLSMAGVRNSN